MGSNKGNDRRERSSLQKTWIFYLCAMRTVLARLENGMEYFALRVTKHPKRILLISAFVIGLSCLGLIRFRSETRTRELLVPQNSVSESALNEGKPFFRNIFNARAEEILFTPKNGQNILSKNCLPEIVSVLKEIASLPGYKRLCYPVPKFLKKEKNASISNSVCRQVNILEIFANDTSNDTLIYETFRKAISNPSLLMSNGRSTAVNVQEALAGFNLNTSAQTVNAKAIRTVMYMKQETETKEIMEWEKSFLSSLKRARGSLKNVSVYFSAERSMDDAIGDSSSHDIGLISVTFTIMSTFACLVLSKFVNPVQGHNLLAFFGVVSTALGILCGIGLTMLFGIPFIRLVGVVPFLVVSVGIDDMFIIVDEFDRQSPKFAPRRRVSNSIAKVGATITMTTITDVIAFFIGTSSAFLDIKYFCIYTAMCISVEFLFQITVFVVFLFLDAKRIDMKRSACLPVLNAPDKNCINMKSNVPFSARILKAYGNSLLKWPVKCFVILLTIAMVAMGIFGCINVDTRFNRSTLAMPNSEFSNYVKVLESNFPLTIPVNIQLTSKVNYSDPRVRKEIANSVQIAYETGYYLNRNLSWVHAFGAYCNKYAIKADDKGFKSAMQKFLSIPQYKQFKADVRFDAKGDIAASRVVVYYKDTSDSNDQKDAMLKIRRDLKQQSKLKFSVIGDPFVYFEQYAAIIEEVVRNLVCVSAVIAVVLIPFCIHPLIIFFILIGFASLIVELFGLMYLWDVQLNTITMITLVMSIGFTVDYSAHIAHAFVISRENTVNGKIKEALTTIGGSVFLGAVSTFLGIALMGFAKSPIFQIFFKMFVGIIFLGLYNGMVLLPVLLSTFKTFIDFQIGSEFSAEDFPFPWKKILRRNSKGSPKEKRMNRNRLVTILGLSARVPSAKTLEEFWELLRKGKCTITEYPEGRYGRKRHFLESFNPMRSVPGKIYVTRGSYLEDVSEFDYTFFGISASEARVMDPQQRLLLQGTYEAIEDAGMTIEELQQCTTGVYVGIMNQEYSSVAFGPDSLPNLDQFAATGNAFSITANRISFSFNLSGPSIAVDTACSSSLTALNIACDHIQKGAVDVAIVAAANVILDPVKQAPICRAGMLASDGQSKVFDERADGYGRGEAALVFILKGSDFVNSSDQPYSEIIAWGMNNDGQTAAPITAPSIEGQVRLMRNVLREANVSPSDVQYVEMHGTGTIIGDSVEVNSVGEVYGRMRISEDPVIVGSVKSNINHTESAAGLAGLAKVCLMIKHGELVPTVGIEKKATRLGLESSGLHVQTENSGWPALASNQPKIATVSSFGFGGSNAHIILRQQQSTCPIENHGAPSPSHPQVLVLSARSKQALQSMAEKFSIWLGGMDNTAENRNDVCYTMSERRTGHSVRLAVDLSSLREASRILEDFSKSPDKSRVEICSDRTNKFCLNTAFVFGGQGSQWLSMAGDLCKRKEILNTIKHVDKKARKYGNKSSLLAYLEKKEQGEAAVEDDMVTVQLSIFALQYATAQFLKKACIVPTFVVGHSLGDITAACVAKIITLKSAIKIIMTRGSLQKMCHTKGAMTAIGMSKNDVLAVIDRLKISENLCIAAENTAKSVTVSGDEDALEKMENHLKEQKSDIFVRRLATDKAFHSHHMESVKWKFMKTINEKQVIAKPAEMRFFSTTEGKEMNGSEVDDCYWWKNLRHTVLFSQCIEKMMKIGVRNFIEISPRPVLSNYITEIGKQNEARDLTVIQALPARKVSQRLMHLQIQCIGRMFTLGYPVNLRQVNNHNRGKFVRYPTYPWQETELWANDNFQGGSKTFPLLGNPIAVNSDELKWSTDIDVHSFSYLKDHQLHSLGPILPGACFIELALEAFLMGKNVVPATVRNITFQKTLPIDDRSVRKLECKKCNSEDGETENFEILQKTEHGEILLSTANLNSKRKGCKESPTCLADAVSRKETAPRDIISLPDVKILPKNGLYPNIDQKEHPKEDFQIEEDAQLLDLAGLHQHEDKLKTSEYKSFAAKTGFDFGERFSLMECIWIKNRKALVRLNLSDELRSELNDYIIHPCILDACLQTRLVVETPARDKAPRIIPIGIEELKLNALPDDIKYLYCLCELIAEDSNLCVVRLMDEKMNVIIKITGLEVKEYSVSERDPKMEGSVYGINLERQSIQNSSKARVDEQFFVVIAEREASYVKTVLEAFQEMNVQRTNFIIAEIDESDDIGNFIDETFGAVSQQKRQLIVLNFLSFLTYRIPLESENEAIQEMLCFEANLKLLQFFNRNKMNNCIILAFNCRNESGSGTREGIITPWSGFSWGMARTTNIESKTPLVCVELKEDFKKDAVIKSILYSDMPSAGEGMVLRDNEILQPCLVKYDSKNSKIETIKCTDENYYLSWSNSDEKFFGKEILSEPKVIPDDNVEVTVLYVSSENGRCEELIENIKSYNSQPLLQMFAGVVRRVGKGVTDFNVGDEVFGFLRSKWIKSVVQLPNELVMLKPKYLTLEQATIVPANVYLASYITSRILKARKSIRSMLLFESGVDEAVVKSIADEVVKKGICVFISHEIQEITCNVKEFTNFNQTEAGHDCNREQFDVILCSSDFSWDEHDGIFDNLVEDGIFAVLNSKQIRAKETYSHTKSMHLIKLQPFGGDTSPKDMMSTVRQILCIDLKNDVKCQDITTLKFDRVSNSISNGIKKGAKKPYSCLALMKYAESLEIRPPSIDFQGLKEDCSYLVVGGTKGIGLYTVAWMASRGAGCILTLSRSDAPADTKSKFKHLEDKYGVRILHLMLDISDNDSIERLDAQLDRLPPVAGVVNSAGVLDDRPFQDIDVSSYKKVMSPKVTGTLVLHSLLEKRMENVDFFVLYSSITSIIGNSGQTSYSAANGFLNSFADYRAEFLKKPCLAVCWGAMGGAGMLQDNVKLATLLEETGLHLLDINTGLKWLERVLVETPTKSTVCICDVDWAKYLKTMQRGNMTMFKHIQEDLPEEINDSGVALLELIKQEASAERQSEIVTKFITGWLAKWIGGSEEEVDCNVPFFTYGIDSVGAAIFKAQIFQHFNVDLEVFYFMLPETTTTSLTKELVKRINESVLAETDAEQVNEPGNASFRKRRESSHRTFNSFRRIAPAVEMDNNLVLPKDYLNCFYDPPDAKAKIFIVHPSHRYAGIFRGMAAGMKYQELFSLYVFGSPDPSYIGEDIQSVRRLAIACTKKILEEQPQGPYFLGGYSFGGLVAIEIASILQEMGKKIAMITMIDSLRWLPEAKSNCQLLMEGFSAKLINKNILHEELKGFFSKIATTQLQMTQAEFGELVQRMPIEDVANHLNERAIALSLEVPKLDKILQGTIDDQEMSKRCHHEWIPRENLYNEHVLFVQAETCLCNPVGDRRGDVKCFCQIGVGSAPDCWSSVLEKQISVVKCPGNHYTMMDQSHAPNVGKALACFASLRYRQLFPMVGRIALNSNHTSTVTLFKNRGLRAIVSRKKLFKEIERAGTVRLSASGNKLKFDIDSNMFKTFDLYLNDIVNVTSEDFAISNGTQKHSKFDRIYAGLRLQKKDNSTARVMCLSKQDFRLFVFLMEALFMIKLPF